MFNDSKRLLRRSTTLGLVWFIIFKNKMKKLQTKSSSHWLVDMKKLAVEENYKNLLSTRL